MDDICKKLRPNFGYFCKKLRPSSSYFCKKLRPSLGYFCKKLRPSLGYFCKKIRPSLGYFCKKIRPNFPAGAGLQPVPSRRSGRGARGMARAASPRQRGLILRLRIAPKNLYLRTCFYTPCASLHAACQHDASPTGIGAHGNDAWMLWICTPYGDWWIFFARFHIIRLI